MDGLQWILAGISLPIIAFVLCRGLAQRRREASSLSAVVLPTVEHSARRMVQQLEVRLRDYSREIESRMQSRLALLDQLIQEADAEIEELNRLLAKRRTNTGRILSVSQRERVWELHELGLDHEEIARCLDCSVHQVDELLNEWRRQAA